MSFLHLGGVSTSTASNSTIQTTTTTTSNGAVTPNNPFVDSSSSSSLKKSKSFQNILQLSLANSLSTNTNTTSFSPPPAFPFHLHGHNFHHPYNHHQNDACIQTMGLDEPANPSLRHVNGKIQINKHNTSHSNRPSSVNTTALYKSTENLSSSTNGSLGTPYNLVDIYLDNNNTHSNHSYPNRHHNETIETATSSSSTMAATTPFGHNQFVGGMNNSSSHGYNFNRLNNGNVNNNPTPGGFAMNPPPPPLQTQFGANGSSSMMIPSLRTTAAAVAAPAALNKIQAPPQLDYSSADSSAVNLNQPFR